MPSPTERHEPDGISLSPNSPDVHAPDQHGLSNAKGEAANGPAARGPEPTLPVRVTKRAPVHRRHVERRTGVVHLLFGAVEDLLADLVTHGAPDGNTVRVERLVRTKVRAMGGAATLGIAITARRADEILSCWVIVARLELDPWGGPVRAEVARRAAVRHREAQHVIGALAADAGFDVRLGLYQLPEDCYGLAATCATLDALLDHAEEGDRTSEPLEPSGAAEPREGAQVEDQACAEEDAEGDTRDA